MVKSLLFSTSTLLIMLFGFNGQLGTTLLNSNTALPLSGTTHNSIISNVDIDHQLWSQLLKKHVHNNGSVNYLGFKKDYKKLTRYIDQLSSMKITPSWTKNQRLAFWINAYNALTIDLIIKNYPLKSIKDIKNPWDQKLWNFDNKRIDLNFIEHNILRKLNEPRIHFAIVCASESCPKLNNEAYEAAILNQQLTKVTTEFLADTSKNEISKDEIKLSRIFKWFKKDFEKNGSLVDFLNQYSDIVISQSASKSYKSYNWELNN